jgi:methyl-accepting chemotaxis protein
MSHRISGPVYRFRVSADSFSEGRLNFNVRLRDKDEMKDVAAAMDSAIGTHRQRMSELKYVSQRMHDSAGALDKALNASGKLDGKQLEKLSDSSSELKEILSFFRT